jgi:hypothetical protein
MIEFPYCGGSLSQARRLAKSGLAAQGVVEKQAKKEFQKNSCNYLLNQ